MSPRGRPEQDREAMKTKILNAARGLFVEKGFEATTMREIASVAGGYTATTLYLYFKDKQAILRDLCDTDFRTLRGAFDEIARVADPVERLCEIGRAYVAFAMTYPNHYRFLFMTSRPGDDPSLHTIEHGNPDQDVYAFVRSAASEAIAAGRLRPEYEDTELVTQILWSAMHGLVALRMTHAKDQWIAWKPINETAEALINVTFRGLMAPGA